MADPLEIRAQGTPNPNAVKFTINRMIATQGTTYRDAAAAQMPWAQQLLRLPGVTQVFALQNFISVTKTPETDWNVLGPQIEGVLRQALS